MLPCRRACLAAKCIAAHYRKCARTGSTFIPFFSGFHQLTQHGQVKAQEHRAASAEAAAAACTRAALSVPAQAVVHASSSSSSATTSSAAAAAAETSSQLQQRLDKVTRELGCERQRCEAAVSHSVQLQQRLDAALSMTSASTALSMGFEALLPPSPPRLSAELQAAPAAAAAASPVPTLHAQLSQVSVSAADARAMASAVAAAAAAVSCTEASTLQRVNARSGAAAASCSRMVSAVSCVLRQQQQMQVQLRENRASLIVAQVKLCMHYTTAVATIHPIVALTPPAAL
jgi:hypothetical protein